MLKSSRMFLTRSTYCSRILNKFEMKLAKAAFTSVKEDVNDLFLDSPVSQRSIEVKWFPF